MKRHTPGQAFEGMITMTCEAYAKQGIARLTKVDPPTRTILVRGKPITVLLKSPFLDFIGTWTAKGGKMVTFECKAVTGPSLRILGPGQDGSGISFGQLDQARRWEDAGALAFFLWHQDGETRLVTPTMVEAELMDRKSLPWEAAHRVPSGQGFIFVDFLALLNNMV